MYYTTITCNAVERTVVMELVILLVMELDDCPRIYWFAEIITDSFLIHKKGFKNMFSKLVTKILIGFSRKNSANRIPSAEYDFLVSFSQNPIWSPKCYSCRTGNSIWTAWMRRQRLLGINHLPVLPEENFHWIYPTFWPQYQGQWVHGCSLISIERNLSHTAAGIPCPFGD